MNASQTEARRWFRQAEADLRVVHTLQMGGHYAAACFYSQQVAEKALKALLYSQGSRVVLGHSVRELVRQCVIVDSTCGEVTEEATLLDQFYIPTRYPNGLPSPTVPSEAYTISQAEAARQAAECILRMVETFLRSRMEVLD